MSRALQVPLSTLLLICLLAPAGRSATQTPQEPKPQQPTEKKDRGIGVQPNTPAAQPDQTKSGTAPRPEIVLQAGISVPQSQINFSPDGRLLASMGMFGNSIKLWEVSTGRLLRQLESSIPTMGASSLSRPFRFSPDGKTMLTLADGRLIRWDVETGREVSNTVLTTTKDFGSALLSEDAQTLAQAKMDNSSVRLWDLGSGRELRSITLDQNEVAVGQDSFALSRDGKFLAVLTQSTKASSFKKIESRTQVTVWNVTSGRQTQTLKLSTKPIQMGMSNAEVGSVAFSPDGSSLAVRNEDSITVWDLSSGRQVKLISAPPLPTTMADSMAMFTVKFLFSPDRNVLALLGDGNKIRLVDMSTGSVMRTLPGHEGTVIGTCFSVDSKLFASAGIDNQIKLWDVATGREIKTFSGAALPLSDIAFSSDGRTLTLAAQGAVSSWELNTGGVKRAINVPENFGQANEAAMLQSRAVLSRDGKMFIAGSKNDAIAKIWDVSSGKEVQTIALTPGKELSNAAFTPDAKMIALSEREKKPEKSATPDPAQNPMGTATGGMAMPDMTKMMEQMRKDPKKAQEEMKKVQDAMSQGDLSAGLTMLESMGLTPTRANASKASNSLRLLEVPSGRQLQTIPLPSGFLSDLTANSFTSSSALSLSPDGRILASANGFYGPLTLRDVNSGQELRSLKSPLTLSINSLAWSPDGKRLAAAGYGLNRNLMDPNTAKDFSFEDVKFAIRIWDPQSGVELQSLPGHGNFVGTLAFSPDGRLLASGSYDSTIKLWNLDTGRELSTLKGHTGSITALAFTPDGKFLVSGSDDGSARLWQTQTGTLLATMVTLNKGSDWLVVTPDGLFDGSPGGWDQILWRFTPGLFDVSPVEIFFSEYFRPGLLPDILAGRKLSAAVDISRKDRRQPKLTLGLPDTLTPTSDISTRSLKVKLDITEAAAGAQDLRLFRNGSLVKAWRGDLLGGKTTATLETTVRVMAGRNEFVAYAFNRDNVKSSDAKLLLNGAETLKRPATLHLLIVGVNKYANSAYDLKYAVADARAFAEEVEAQQRKLGRFQRIEVTSLLDQDATKANLLDVLKRLRGDQTATPANTIGANIKAAEPEDAVIVYFAGHGTAQDQRFYLIPHDIGYQGSRTELDRAGLQTILSHSISDVELEQAFADLDAGLVVMVIDACNSGQALEAEEKRRGPMNSKGLAQLAYEKGMYILTAAQSYQAALEAEQLGHGYLTFALVEEGLKSGAADNEPHDNQVMLREWLDYATERVPRMQEAKLRDTRGVKLVFVEGEEQVTDVDKRSLQRPRVFYRRELEADPLVVARPE